LLAVPDDAFRGGIARPEAHPGLAVQIGVIELGPIRLNTWRSCPPQEYQWAHLPGAISGTLDDSIGQLDRSQPDIGYRHARV
jgi:hypothetical protein